MVKTVKSDTPLDLRCETPGMLSAESKLSQVKVVEQMLQIDSSEHINDTLTNEELKTASKMFLYLNTCPNNPWFKSWSSFYKDLFLTQPADKIILTLNRMMKTAETSQDMDGKLRTEKLLKRTLSLMSLSLEIIQSMLSEKLSRNGSVNKDFIFKNGKRSFLLFCNLKICFQHLIYIRFR